jgi:4-hydroxybenzoate polyprenyltransferase
MSPTSRKPPTRRKAPPTGARKPIAPPTVARPADASTTAERVLAFLLRGLPPARREKLHAYLVLTRMDRPIGALLLMWPTWWALWLAAKDFPPVGPLVIFTLGVFAMRSAGCAINDYADRKLDPLVARTKGRPIASGRVTPREALVVFAVLLAFSFVLVLFTNKLTILLSFAGAALAALYPFTKRYTHLPQVVLGAAFGWSIPMAFAAVTNNVPPVAWLLFIGNILWSTLYDTEYAMVDREEDIKAGAKSTAILFADADLVIIGVLMGSFLLTMLLVGTRSALGWPYWLALAVTAGLFAWQQWIMRDRDRDACLAAFRHNNWVGLTLWLGIVIALAL